MLGIRHKKNKRSSEKTMVVVKDITYSLTNAACLTLLLDSSQITHFLLRVSAWTAANISLLQESARPRVLREDCAPHLNFMNVTELRLHV